MTIRDPEVLELLEDNPELLALADAFATTQRPPRSRRLRLTAPRLLTVGAVVAAVIIAFLLSPGSSGNHSIIDRALAAIGNGRVLHLVTQSPTGTVFVDLQSGHRTVQTIESEAWYDGKSKRGHLIVRMKGQVVGDLLLPEDAARPGVTFSGGIDPAYAALATGYRKALASGQAKLERTSMLHGKPVYWLRFPSFQPNTPGTEVAIDTKTYKPVIFRNHFSRVQYADERVLVAETTGFRTSDFTRRGPSLLEGLASGSMSSGSSSSTEPPPRQPRVKAPWLTPGNRGAGLRLTAVNPVTVTSGKLVIHGVILVYGSAPPLAVEAPLEIQELPRPDDPASWRSIPSGSVSVQKSEAGNSQDTHLMWTGTLVKHGLYVTITMQAQGNERAVVALARALHPAR